VWPGVAVLLCCCMAWTLSQVVSPRTWHLYAGSYLLSSRPCYTTDCSRLELLILSPMPMPARASPRSRRIANCPMRCVPKLALPCRTTASPTIAPTFCHVMSCQASKQAAFAWRHCFKARSSSWEYYCSMRCSTAFVVNPMMHIICYPRS
jgi:hypothetical protein